MIEEDIEKAKSKLNETLKEWQKIIDLVGPTERKEIESSLYMEDIPFEYIRIIMNYINKLEEEINQLKIAIDYYKKMYLECNNFFIENNLEEMLRDLEKRYEVYGKRK